MESIVLTTFSTQPISENLNRHRNLELGIFVDIEFGSLELHAQEAFHAFRKAGIEAQDPEESSRGWSVRLNLDLLESEDWNQVIDRISSIASLFGGHLRSSLPPLDSVDHWEQDQLRNAALSAFKMGRWSECDDRWEELGHTGGATKSEIEFWKGMTLLRKNEIDQAKEVLERTLEAPGETTLRHLAMSVLGRCHLMRREIDRAEPLFLDLLETRLIADGQYGLAACRCLERNYQTAFGWLRLAFKRSPELKGVARHDPSFGDLSKNAEFQELIERRMLDRFRTAWNRSSFPWKRSSDFVDRLESWELY